MAGCGKHDGLVGSDFSTRIQASTFYPKFGPRQGDIAVSIHGKNFTKGIRVFFGEVEAQDVRVLDDTTLEVSLPPGDFGQVMVRLVLEEQEEILPEPFSYKAEEIDLRFQEDLGFSDYDAAYAAGDFNGDGFTDIVVASQGKLSLYLNSDKGFEFHRSYQVPLAMNFRHGCIMEFCHLDSFKYSLEVLDYNLDGYLDVVFSSLLEQKLFLFAGDAKLGLATPIISENPRLLDSCSHRYLEVVDLNQDKVDDLFVINHVDDADSWPLQPEPFGSLGVILSFGTPNEKTFLVEDDLGCDFLHSYLYDPNQPNKLDLLCHQNKENDYRELHFITLELISDELVVADNSQITPHEISGLGRYRLYNYDFKGDKKILGLYFEQIPNDAILYEDEAVIKPVMLDSNILVELYNYHEINCENGNIETGHIPQVMAANVIGDSNKELVVLCPGADKITYVGFKSQETIKVSQDVDYLVDIDLRGPDFSNVGFYESPIMPSLAVFDINNDQIDEFFVSSPWGRNYLLYSIYTYWEDYPDIQLSTLAMVYDSEEQDRQLRYSSNHPRNYRAGIPVGMCIDIDNDGDRDMVTLYAEPGIAIRYTSSDGDQGPLQEIIWQRNDLKHISGMMLVEDLNSDGLLDFIVPIFDFDLDFNQITTLDIVLSGPNGYSFEKTVSFDQLYENIRLINNNSNGQIVIYAYKSYDYICESSECYSLCDVVAFRRDIDGEFLVSQPVATGIKIPGQLYDVVDLDRDGLPDLISSDGLVCWGHSLEKCQDPLEFSPLFSEYVYDIFNTLNMSIIYSEITDAIEIVAIDGFDMEGEWLSFYKDAPPISREFSLNVAPGMNNFIDLSRSTVCDLNGDGNSEVVFMGILESSSETIFGLFPNDDDSLADWRILGQPKLNLMEIGCLGRNFQGIDDLIIRDYNDLLFRVPNRSK
jgi:hypothetical protein